jgi:hypothetical protein
MTQREALELIERESGESGLHVAARMGEDLDPARIARLVSTIQTVTESLRGYLNLDRNLAASLHILGLQVLRQAEGWASNCNQKLPKAVFDSLINLESAVEDFFFDIAR